MIRFDIYYKCLTSFFSFTDNGLGADAFRFNRNACISASIAAFSLAIFSFLIIYQEDKSRVWDMYYRIFCSISASATFTEDFASSSYEHKIKWLQQETYRDAPLYSGF